METDFKQFICKRTRQGVQIYSTMCDFTRTLNEDATGVSFADITDEWLGGYAEYMRERICGNSAKTYFSVLKTTLKRAKMTRPKDVLTDNYKEILTAKGAKAIRCYLTMKELKKIEKYAPTSKIERAVRAQFLIGAYTGARQSDFRELTTDNINDGMLSYISKKTHIKAVVPVKPIVVELLNELNELPDVTLCYFNRVLRRMCAKIGINSPVRVFSSGEQKEGEKWQFLSSHTARISFATNLYFLGLNIVTIAKMMGHTNISQTYRYIVDENIELPEKVNVFFK